MSESRIRFSTDILLRLGEELNPGIDQSILELVKNAYDADASKCTIELSRVRKSGGTIRIEDDGTGMSAAGIEAGWLVIGRSGKTEVQRTPLGRVPAGSKGLGRLAALRLGRMTTLITRPNEEPNYEYYLKIDWSLFDNVGVVEDVALDVVRRRRSEELQNGTTIEISNLRTAINRGEISRLSRSLILLANPFEAGGAASFRPELKTSEFRDLGRLVKKRYFDGADFHLHAVLDATGFVEAQILDWKGQVLHSGKHEDIAPRRKNEPFRCPPAVFDLWQFRLGGTTFAPRPAPISAIREWLRTFGGVHIYTNELRVAPYGSPGNDWLDMNLARARSPEERPSTNNSIGRVQIEDPTRSLQQKTDRSGFIESESFSELKAFVTQSLDWMARRRLAAAEEIRSHSRKQAPVIVSKNKSELEVALSKLPDHARSSLTAAVQKYEKSRDKEVAQLHREIQLYRTLSTAGITAATFAHESTGNPLKSIVQSANAIKRRIERYVDGSEQSNFEQPLASIFKATTSITSLSDATLSLLDSDKRRVAKVLIHKVIANVFETMKPFLDGRKIHYEFQFCNRDPYLQGSEAAVESIISNLVNNSVFGFGSSSTRNRSILVTTEVLESRVNISFADNGPGIEEISIKDIWLPGQTTRPNGTGLGLTIVRDAVRDLGGHVAAKEHGVLGGAEFYLRIPILGS